MHITPGLLIAAAAGGTSKGAAGGSALAFFDSVSESEISTTEEPVFIGQENRTQENGPKLTARKMRTAQNSDNYNSVPSRAYIKAFSAAGDKKKVSFWKKLFPRDTGGGVGVRGSGRINMWTSGGDTRGSHADGRWDDKRTARGMNVVHLTPGSEPRFKNYDTWNFHEHGTRLGNEIQDALSGDIFVIVAKGSAARRLNVIARTIIKDHLGASDIMNLEDHQPYCLIGRKGTLPGKAFRFDENIGLSSRSEPVSCSALLDPENTWAKPDDFICPSGGFEDEDDLDSDNPADDFELKLKEHGCKPRGTNVEKMSRLEADSTRNRYPYNRDTMVTGCYFQVTTGPPATGNQGKLAVVVYTATKPGGPLTTVIPSLSSRVEFSTCMTRCDESFKLYDHRGYPARYSYGIKIKFICEGQKTSADADQTAGVCQFIRWKVKCRKGLGDPSHKFP